VLERESRRRCEKLHGCIVFSGSSGHHAFLVEQFSLIAADGFDKELLCPVLPLIVRLPSMVTVARGEKRQNSGLCL
jgi:hypothetical protein